MLARQRQAKHISFLLQCTKLQRPGHTSAETLPGGWRDPSGSPAAGRPPGRDFQVGVRSSYHPPDGNKAPAPALPCPPHQCRPNYRAARSEEHTSELQSLMRISYAVFCLKKKTTEKDKKINTYLHHSRNNTNNNT